MKTIEQWERNWKVVAKSDEKAKKAGRLVGRYITHPIADGNAVYLITKATKKTATIKVVTEIGDDWQIPAWGAKAVIELNLAKNLVSQRDQLSKLFPPINLRK